MTIDQVHVGMRVRLKARTPGMWPTTGSEGVVTRAPQMAATASDPSVFVQWGGRMAPRLCRVDVLEPVLQ